MEAIEKVMSIVLYAVMFVAATFIAYMLYGSLRQQNKTVAEHGSSKASVEQYLTVDKDEMDFDSDGSGNKVVTIEGNEVFQNILDLIDTYSYDELAAGKISVWIPDIGGTPTQIPAAKMVNLKDRKKTAISDLIAQVDSSRSYKRIYIYDTDLTLIEVRFVII